MKTEITSIFFLQVGSVKSRFLTRKVVFENDVNVWISGSMDGVGKIGVYFGKDDIKNHVGYFLYSKPILPTRLRLAGCIKAMDILYNYKATPCNLLVHIETRYLFQCMEVRM